MKSIVSAAWSVEHQKPDELVKTDLALGQLRLNSRPGFALCSVAEKIHDDGTLRNGLIHLEQIPAWNPAILLSFLPRGAILAHPNDHVKPVVAEVQTLPMTLRTVANECEGIIFEVLLVRL